MDVDITVTRREDAAMPGRVEPDNGGLDPRQLEYELDFLMLLHVMWRVADPVEDVELDHILLAGNQKRQRLFRIEAGSFAASGTKRARSSKERTAAGIGILIHCGTSAHYEKRHPDVEAAGHVHRAVGSDAGQRGTVVGDRHFAAELFDRSPLSKRIYASQASVRARTIPPRASGLGQGRPSSLG